MSNLAVRVSTVFCLGVNIEDSSQTKSGFKPARVDPGSQKELFGDLRLKGFASMIRLGFADDIIVIGKRMGQMLANDYGAKANSFTWVPSIRNGVGELSFIEQCLGGHELEGKECAIVSSFFHVVRLHCMMQKKISVYPAEAFWLIENPDRKSELIRRLGKGPLAERSAEEIQGIAARITGTYKPRN